MINMIIPLSVLIYRSYQNTIKIKLSIIKKLMASTIITITIFTVTFIIIIAIITSIVVVVIITITYVQNW